MTKNKKVIVVYIVTIALMILNTPLMNGATLFEKAMNPLGITSFFSNGTTGIYYPSIGMLLIGLALWLYLRKLVPNSKYSKDYFYYCFGIIVILAVIKNWLQLG